MEKDLCELKIFELTFTKLFYSELQIVHKVTRSKKLWQDVFQKNYYLIKTTLCVNGILYIDLKYLVIYKVPNNF